MVLTAVEKDRVIELVAEMAKIQKQMNDQNIAHQATMKTLNNEYITKQEELRGIVK